MCGAVGQLGAIAIRYPSAEGPGFNVGCGGLPLACCWAGRAIPMRVLMAGQ